jgi:membrane associated rhomboid family serine protease
MRRPPPVSYFWKFPFTGGTCLLAIAATLAAWGRWIDPKLLEENYRAWHGQPWRLLTSALLHVDVLHLAFNVYWTWVFGTLIEEVFGSVFIASLVVLLAIGSAAAEYAVNMGGVGLSGVGYGLFGFLWSLEKYDRRFAGIIDAGTVRLFVAWFFLCIVATAAHVMSIGNVAHGAGLVLGIISGYIIASRGTRRAVSGVVLAGLAVIILVCATVLRPTVNFSKWGNHDEFQLGYDALMAERYDEAARYLRRATAFRYADANCWFDLGLACQQLGSREEADNAFRHALALQPDSQEFRLAVKSIEHSSGG